MFFCSLMLTSGLLMADTGALPKDFNHQEYLSLHQDLQDHVAKNNLDAKSFSEEHYTNNGIQEGRQYKSIESHLPADFNWKNYLALNPDLRQYLSENRNLNSEQFAKEHYINYGKAEGRIFKKPAPSVPSDFDATMYLELNPDLAVHAKNSSVVDLKLFAQTHYADHGKTEHRFYKAADKIAELTKKVEAAGLQKNHTVESLHELSEALEHVMLIKKLTPKEKNAVEELHNKIIKLMFNTPGALRL